MPGIERVEYPYSFPKGYLITVDDIDKLVKNATNKAQAAADKSGGSYEYLGIDIHRASHITIVMRVSK